MNSNSYKVVMALFDTDSSKVYSVAGQDGTRWLLSEYFPSWARRVRNGGVAVDEANKALHENGVREFLRVAGAAVSVDHALPQIIDIIRENGTGYVIWEDIMGVSLKDYLRRRGAMPSVGFALNAFLPIMLALHKASVRGAFYSLDLVVMQIVEGGHLRVASLPKPGGALEDTIGSFAQVAAECLANCPDPQSAPALKLLRATALEPEKFSSLMEFWNKLIKKSQKSRAGMVASIIVAVFAMAGFLAGMNFWRNRPAESSYSFEPGYPYEYYDPYEEPWPEFNEEDLYGHGYEDEWGDELFGSYVTVNPANHAEVMNGTAIESGGALYYKCVVESDALTASCLVKEEDGKKTVLASHCFPAFIQVADGYAYYSDGMENLNIYRVRSGEQPTLVVADTAGFLQLHGGYIYYSNASDWYSLYRVKLDGTGREKLGYAECYELVVIGDILYYVDAQYGDAVFRMDLSSDDIEPMMFDEEPAMNLRRMGDSLTYVQYVKGYVTVRSEEGDFIPFPYSVETYCFDVVGDTFYYIDGAQNLARLEIKGGSRKNVYEKGCYFVMTAGDQAFFFDLSGYQLFRMRLDGIGEPSPADFSA
ncbi:MAG: DUF5050 domain-containing protein [Clostridiales bacterium]|jgi:hypothetical protein|nr:DUF5050 domain-containing protein [Clostridiales bacterium]